MRVHNSCLLGGQLLHLTGCRVYVFACIAITNAVVSEGMVDMEMMEAASKSGRRAPRALDVAAVAGVSTATVSRTFNAPEKVAPAIRERVLAAAAALDWIPHAAGSA